MKEKPKEVKGHKNKSDLLFIDIADMALTFLQHLIDICCSLHFIISFSTKI